MLNSTSVDPQVYTDLNQLQQLKAQSRVHDPKTLQTVARQFESMMLSMMLKSMREANKAFSDGSYLDSDQTRFYQDMYDSQLSVSLAEKSSLGLADVLVRQLGGQPAKTAKTDVGRLQTPALGIGLEPAQNNLKALSGAPQIAARAHASLQEVDALVRKMEQQKSQPKPESSSGVGETAPVPSVPGDAADAPLHVEKLDPLKFDSPEEFVAQLYPIAKKVGDELGVDPKVLLAQSALETGWGQHLMPRGAGSSYNLFGIKADSRWSGATTEVTTTEYREGVPLREKASFRAYDSYEASFRDYLAFLRSNPRYQNALQVSGNSEAFLGELQQAGYATDPHYRDKITNILQGERFQNALLEPNG